MQPIEHTRPYIDVVAQDRKAGTNHQNGLGKVEPSRCLLSREEFTMLLHLNDDQVQYLINTRQIVAIRIAGEERFDLRDINQLIDSYKATAVRSTK